MVSETDHSSTFVRIDFIFRFEVLLGNIIRKFDATAGYLDRLKILTLSPFTIKDTKDFFETSTYMAERASHLRNKHGILPDIPKYSKGKVVTQNIIDEVISFYEDERISKEWPGMRQVKIATDDEGKPVYKPKRLLLGSLKYLYCEYKSQVETKLESYEKGEMTQKPNPLIGFSTFASLRPKYCILVGPKGTHNVCVCKYHQNPKLMIAAIGIRDLTYKTLMKKCVCNENIDSLKCMLQTCEKCPGKSGVKNYLNSLEILNDKTNIVYKQWVGTDRSEILELNEDVETFIDKLSSTIFSLTRHHVISRQQLDYYKYLKDNLPDNEVIVVGDFAENYNITVQNEIQGFHWTNIQLTLHPFVVYYNKTECDKKVLDHLSYCFITDYLKHNSAAVYQFQKELTDDLKVRLPGIKKIHYFSDGCAGQYKSKYAFNNLCNHEADFGIAAEWNFFATSHGKNPCDGIGGNLKLTAYKHSLQCLDENHILNAEDFHKVVSEKCKKVKSILVSTAKIHATEKFLENRFNDAMPLIGTRSFHRIVPIDKCKVKAYVISIDSDYKVSTINKKDNSYVNIDSSDIKDCLVGSYVSVLYDKKCYIGLIELISEEFNDYYVQFLEQTKDQNVYKFNTKKRDACWVMSYNVLEILTPPELKKETSSSRMINYVFQKKEINKSINDATKRVNLIEKKLKTVETKK